LRLDLRLFTFVRIRGFPSSFARRYS